MRIIQPSVVRVVGAFCVASLVAAAPALLTGVPTYAFPIAFLIALGHVLLLGAPTYLLLRRRLPIGWAEAMLSGALIAVTPTGLYVVFQLPELTRDDPHLGDMQILVWVTLAFLAVMGLVAGTMFRAVLGPPQIEPEVDPSIFE